MTENACYTSALPFVYDSPGEARDTIREVSNSASHTVAEVSRGNQFNAKDRADQDRYLAGEFRQLGVQSARVDSVIAAAARDVSDHVERNGRSAELATEKTGAATILAIEKTAAAAALALQECCCEIRTKIAEDGEKTRALVSQIDRERLQARLAVLETLAAK